MARGSNLAPNAKRRDVEVEQCVEDSPEGQDRRRGKFNASDLFK